LQKFTFAFNKKAKKKFVKFNFTQKIHYQINPSLKSQKLKHVKASLAEASFKTKILFLLLE